MNRQVHGTTNICVPCENGIIIGNNSRITNSYQTKEGTGHEIMSDEECKLFQLYSEPNMYCTLMGDVEEWHNMYTHLLMLKEKPKSVLDAAKRASEYLETYRVKNRRSSLFKECGTIIAGYEKKKGFQMRGVKLSIKAVVVDDDKIIALGSGSKAALTILKKIPEGSTMTRATAVTVTLKALMRASFDDDATGTKLKVTFVHENGCISETYQLLAVYSALYEPSDEEKATLIVVYSSRVGPFFGKNSIHTLIDSLGGARLKFKYNIIAKKADFYITRIELQKEKDATKFYEHLSKGINKPLFPAGLDDVRNYLIDCVTNKSKDHVYVGISSKQLLEGLTRLQDADTLKY